MFGALKKLFGKEEEAPQQPPQAKPAAAPSQQTRPPAAAPAPAAASAKPTAAYSAPPDGQAVQIPLKSIAEVFPPQLASYARSAPKGNFALSLSHALSGLARGSVTVPFGHLRQAAPNAFGDDGVHDATEVSIPIQEIVPRLPKGAFARNPAQKPFQTPKIGDLFGSRGEALKPVDHEFRAPEAPTSRITPAAPAPTPVAPAITKAPVAPVVSPSPMPEPKPAEEATVFEAPKLVPQEKISIALPTLEPQKPIAPANLPQPPAPKPAAPVSAPFASATPTAPAAPKISTAGQNLSVPFASVSTAWPPGIRQELAVSQAQTINIPLDRIESALKTGKVVFRYAEIRAWAVPAVSTPSQMDEVELDLPLNVVAPLFMAKAKPAAPRSTVSLENIPDVFAGTKPTAPAAEPAPVKMVAPAAPIAAPTPIPAPPAPKPAAATMPQTPPAPTAPSGPRPAPNVLGTIFGEPNRSDWPPAEIVKKTAAFRGVSGAVIGSHDGLLIAAQVGEGLNGDAIAGLLAQVCQKLNQQATELKLNPVTELNVVFGDSTWRIFRLKENYFIVIGKPKEELPAAQLRMIANELGKR